MPRGQGRAHRRHDVADAVLVGHQHVGVALDDRQTAGRLPREPGLVEAVDLVALGEQRRVTRVVVFRTAGR